MELYGRGSSGSDRPLQWVSGPGSEGSTGRLGREPGLFPVRPGFQDCVFYMRTGSCSYGAKCRYNHPRHRSSVGVVVRYGGEPPERPGEPACPFYLRTGTCKFGASCKFHHPRNSEAYSNIRLNTNGYPLRPGEKECSYYLKTGQCNFGIACKFHHPQLLNGRSMPPTSPLPFYPSVQTPPGRPPPPPLLPGSYVPHGTFGPVLVPPGVVPIPSWSTYSGPVSPAMSSNAPPGGAGSPYGLPQLPSLGQGFAGPYHTFSPSSLGPSSSIQKPNVFPVRPGQPNCQFYLKTGDCKFGLCCKFNHPPGGGASLANCAFSSLGLPLRPGEQPCSFYMKNGSCKFERMCKFDHPMAPIRYSPSASSLTDFTVAPYMIGSPLSTLAPSFSYSELIPGTKPLTFLNGGTSSGNTSASSVGLIFQPNGPAFSSIAQTRSPLV